MTTPEPLFADSQSGAQALGDLLGPGRPTVGGSRALLAPLYTERHVLGLAVFLRGKSRAPFRTDELSTAARLAAHTALGVQVTTLHRREVARVLQRGMMPPSLPQTSGVDLAARYLPATGTAEVGGDWYDAIPLPHGRVGLVVGDVMGRSIGAVKAMGNLRTAVRALAAGDPAPQELLRHLDTLTRRIEPDRLATCLYAVWDPAIRRLSIAAAGHLPPILVEPDGRTGILDVPTGPPLGVGSAVPEAVEVEAPAGSTLVLYTDGLVESRTRDVSIGLQLLCETLGGTGPDGLSSLDALCDEALGTLPAGDRDDDVALLAARFPGPAADRVEQWVLDATPRSPARARHLVRIALERWGLEAIDDPVLLLVNELVTNAVIFTSGRITLRLVYTDVLRCEIGDDVREPPRLKKGGMGLYLVERLSQRWGSRPAGTGKVVWFECDPPEVTPP
ncbi:SpoIIE family protein phosphatase [Streptomyces sp. NPDC096205]|uniref:ATP-binding SpoIIE family protein phosphatase n=1 Tax=Streptomyces sp. NPDC096205 TaxID=3366081 RepID=UPI003816A64D